MRRYITRPPDENEQNFFVDEKAFTLLCNSNFFVSHWQANGYRYGISMGDLSSLPENALAVISVSRGAVSEFEEHFRWVTTLILTVEKDILRQRLLSRAREDEEAIERRLTRAELPVKANNPIFFENSDELSNSAARFCLFLESLLST